MDNKDYLSHYASKYYDPVKAHEYYMRTRELKGRRSASKLDDDGKKAWAYTKDQITESKKADVQEKKDKRDSNIAEYRATAEAYREQISSRLKELKDALTKDSKEERTKISSDRDLEIERIKNISGLSAEEKREMIAEVRAEASQDKADVSERTKTEKQAHQSEAKERKALVAKKLKTAITAAREAFKVAKQSLNESYESIYQDEYDKILSEYAKQKSE